MAVQIYVKTQNPFIEKVIKATNIDDTILVGIKLPKEVSERNKLSKTFQQFTQTGKTKRKVKRLEIIENDSSLSDEDFDKTLSNLTNEINNLTDLQIKNLDSFYKEQVLYIKNAVITTKDEDGVISDITILDTRTAEPIESLWANPKECLAVLLDVYMDSLAFRDSLQQEILSVIFNIDFEALQAKN